MLEIGESGRYVLRWHQNNQRLSKISGMKIERDIAEECEWKKIWRLRQLPRYVLKYEWIIRIDYDEQWSAREWVQIARIKTMWFFVAAIFATTRDAAIHAVPFDACAEAAQLVAVYRSPWKKNQNAMSTCTPFQWIASQKTYSLRDVVWSRSIRRPRCTIVTHRPVAILWIRLLRTLTAGLSTAYTINTCVDCHDMDAFRHSPRILLSIVHYTVVWWPDSSHAVQCWPIGHACPLPCSSSHDSLRSVRVQVFAAFETCPWWVRRISPARTQNQRLKSLVAWVSCAAIVRTAVSSTDSTWNQNHYSSKIVKSIDSKNVSKWPVLSNDIFEWDE